MNLASRSDAEDSNALETTCFAELISNLAKGVIFQKVAGQSEVPPLFVPLMWPGLYQTPNVTTKFSPCIDPLRDFTGGTLPATSAAGTTTAF